MSLRWPADDDDDDDDDGTISPPAASGTVTPVRLILQLIVDETLMDFARPISGAIDALVFVTSARESPAGSSPVGSEQDESPRKVGHASGPLYSRANLLLLLEAKDDYDCCCC